MGTSAGDAIPKTRRASYDAFDEAAGGVALWRRASRSTPLPSPSKAASLPAPPNPFLTGLVVESPRGLAFLWRWRALAVLGRRGNASTAVWKASQGTGPTRAGSITFVDDCRPPGQAAVDPEPPRSAPLRMRQLTTRAPGAGPHRAVRAGPRAGARPAGQGRFGPPSLARSR